MGMSNNQWDYTCITPDPFMDTSFEFEEESGIVTIRCLGAEGDLQVMRVHVNAVLGYADHIYSLQNNTGVQEK